MVFACYRRPPNVSGSQESCCFPALGFVRGAAEVSSFVGTELLSCERLALETLRGFASAPTEGPSTLGAGRVALGLRGFRGRFRGR